MKIKHFLYSLIFLVFFIGIGYFAYTSDTFKITGVNWVYINEVHPRYNQSLHKKLEKINKEVVGKGLWAVDIFDLEQQFSTFNWIKNVSIIRNFPNRLTIELNLKPIAALVIISGKKVVPVSDKGELLQSSSLNNSPDVPVLVGKKFRSNSKLRFEVTNILSQIPNHGMFNPSEINEVKLNRKNNFVYNLKKHQVILGKKNIDVKIERVNKVLNYLDQKHLHNRVIDADFSKKVLVRLRNRP